MVVNYGVFEFLHPPLTVVTLTLNFISQKVGSEVAPTRTFAVGGLEAGSRYDLRVTAHNSAGATPAHYTVNTPGQGNVGKSIICHQRETSAAPT